MRQRRNIRLAVSDREVAKPIHTGNAGLIGLSFGHTVISDEKYGASPIPIRSETNDQNTGVLSGTSVLAMDRARE